jgi:cyclophilin family peptidyl-prolyl cis-trans isomerase
MKFFFTILFCALVFNTSFAQAKKIAPAKKPAVKMVSKTIKTTSPKLPGTRIKITTDSGVIIVRLYDSTPLHRDNFIALVKSKFFDSLLFHRVINGFMIQGGDPQSKNATAGAMLGAGGGELARIPAEFKGSLYHKKGALSAARDGNPEKASSACQFYLVQGKMYSDEELNMIEVQIGKKYSPKQREIYKKIGGTPFLDNNYTVFGEIEKGLNIVDKIAGVAVDGNNRPNQDVRMKIELLK